MSGASVESRIVAALFDHLVEGLRNADPARGVLEPCVVRLDPPATEPARDLWWIDIFSAGIGLGDRDSTASDHHVARLDIAMMAPPGDALRDLFWAVHRLAMQPAWFTADVVDVRPLNGGAVQREQQALLEAVAERTLSYEIEFFTDPGDGF